MKTACRVLMVSVASSLTVATVPTFVTRLVGISDMDGRPSSVLGCAAAELGTLSMNFPIVTVG